MSADQKDPFVLTQQPKLLFQRRQTPGGRGLELSNEGLIEGLRGEEEDCRAQGSQKHEGRQVGLQRKVTGPRGR